MSLTGQSGTFYTQNCSTSIRKYHHYHEDFHRRSELNTREIEPAVDHVADLMRKPFLNLKCGLSEGPFWEEQDNVLRFVDIVGKAVYRVNLNEGPSSLKKQQYEHSISCVRIAPSSTSGLDWLS